MASTSSRGAKSRGALSTASRIMLRAVASRVRTRCTTTLCTGDGFLARLLAPGRSCSKRQHGVPLSLPRTSQRHGQPEWVVATPTTRKLRSHATLLGGAQMEMCPCLQQPGRRRGGHGRRGAPVKAQHLLPLLGRRALPPPAMARKSNQSVLDSTLHLRLPRKPPPRPRVVAVTVTVTKTKTSFGLGIQ